MSISNKAQRIGLLASYLGVVGFLVLNEVRVSRQYARDEAQYDKSPLIVSGAVVSENPQTDSFFIRTAQGDYKVFQPTGLEENSLTSKVKVGDFVNVRAHFGQHQSWRDSYQIGSDDISIPPEATFAPQDRNVMSK